MPRSITPQTFQVHGVFHATDAPSLDVVARLVRSFEDPEPLATVLKHLRHEREIPQATLFVERRQDFILTADFHPFSNSQIQNFRPVRVTFMHCIPSLASLRATGDG